MYYIPVFIYLLLYINSCQLFSSHALSWDTAQIRQVYWSNSAKSALLSYLLMNRHARCSVVLCLQQLKGNRANAFWLKVCEESRVRERVESICSNGLGGLFPQHA